MARSRSSRNAPAGRRSSAWTGPGRGGGGGLVVVSLWRWGGRRLRRGRRRALLRRRRALGGNRRDRLSGHGLLRRGCKHAAAEAHRHDSGCAQRRRHPCTARALRGSLGLAPHRRIRPGLRWNACLLQRLSGVDARAHVLDPRRATWIERPASLSPPRAPRPHLWRADRAKFGRSRPRTATQARVEPYAWRSSRSERTFACEDLVTKPRAHPNPSPCALRLHPT